VSYYPFSSIDQFAQIYAERLGIKEEVLRKTLWGDWYLDAKNKVWAVYPFPPPLPPAALPAPDRVRCLTDARWAAGERPQRVVGRDQGKGRFKPLFVQFVLENLWAVYDAAMLRPYAHARLFPRRFGRRLRILTPTVCAPP